MYCQQCALARSADAARLLRTLSSKPSTSVPRPRGLTAGHSEKRAYTSSASGSSAGPSRGHNTRGPQRGAFGLAALLLGGTGTGLYFWQQATPATPQLSYSHFTPLSLRSVERVTPDSSIITLELPAHLLPDPAAYPEPADTPLQAIYIRQPELQIQRAYTPLSLDCFEPKNREGSAPDVRAIRMLVKRYNDGEVSSYLHRLKAQDTVYARGPVRTWTLPECEHLIFIAGGTGITPLAQLLHQKAPLPSKITLLYTSSTPETSLLAHTLPREQLDRLEIHACTSRLSQRQVSQVVGQAQKAGQTQIIVCGPDGFISSIAGPRGLNAARDPVTGILGELGWTEANVKKL